MSGNQKILMAIGLFLTLTAVSSAGGWLEETIVNTVTEGKQASRGTDTPWSIVADNNGRIHVVWEDRRNERILSIYYRGKSPSPNWNNWDNQDINISPIDSIELIGHPSIGTLDNGSLISVFAEERTFGGELLGTTLPNGFACWAQPQFISIPGGNSLSFNSTGWQTTIATNGHRAITFWPYIGNELNDFRPIFFRKFQDGSWNGDEIPLALPEIGLRYFAKNLSAVWARLDTIYLVFAGMPENQLIYSIYFVKVDFIDNTIIDFQQIASDSVVSQEFPYICRQTDKYGNEDIFIAYESRGVSELAKLRYYSENSEYWASPLILGDTLISSAYPCLAVNPSGTIELAFEQPGNEPNSQIYQQTFDPDSKTLANPIRISNGDYFSKRPVIACDKFGNSHVAYISNRIHPWDPGNEEVYYRMYDSPPLPPRNVLICDDTISWDYDDPPDLRYFQVFTILNGDTLLIGATLNHYFRHGFGTNGILGVRAVDLSGQSSPLVVADIRNGIEDQTGNIPDQLLLGSNYPNPFNSNTTFKLSGKNAGINTGLDILDVTGRLVKQIHIPGNALCITWDGTNQNQVPVASGIYLYRLAGEKQTGPIRKMVLLR
jgi:hypothetical protein